MLSSATCPMRTRASGLLQGSVFVAGAELMRGLRAAGEAAGAKDRVGLPIGNFQPLEERANGGLVWRKESGGFGGEFEMQISDRPANAGCGGGRDLERDFDH